MNLRNFAKRARVLGDNVERNTDALVRKVALAVDAAVVLATPVDTGRARLNWQVDLNNEPQGTLPEPSSATGATQTSLANAKAVIDGYKNGDVVHITNNLDYIGRLDEGWSAQAPAGFVEEAVNIGVNAVKGAKVVYTKSSE